MLEKQLRKYIFPNILSMAGISVYILADTFFISVAEGTDGITALNIVLPLYGIIYALGAMLGVGAATRYALHKAVGNKSADEYFSNSFMWSLIISLPFVIMGFTMPDTILTLMGADAKILQVGLDYIKIVLWCTPFFILNYTFTSFVRNDGAPNIAMAATLISGGFNIVFDYILMFPMRMGIAGAALATGISPIVSMLICMCHYLSKKNTIKFVKKLPSVHKLIESCKLGMVAFVGEISSGITTLVFNFILLDLAGNIAVAAYGVIANTAIIVTALLNGVAQGLQPLASEMHGKNDLISEKKIYRSSLKIAIVISLIAIVFIFAFPHLPVNLFNSENSSVLSLYATKGIKIYFTGFFIAAVNIVVAAFYSATDKARESSVIAISRGVVAIVVFAFILSKLFGITGVWLAFPVAEIFTFLLSKFIKKLC